MKGATPYPNVRWIIFDISIHAPVKGATPENHQFQQDQWISIHAPVKGATSPHSRCPRPHPYFNPRSREGSDASHAAALPRLPISIHAPVKGATVENIRPIVVRMISIHAPVKGATSGARPVSRADPISIHAPVKGATRHPDRECDRPRHFNPRSREGSDADADDAVGVRGVFQSTLP